MAKSLAPGIRPHPRGNVLQMRIRRPGRGWEWEPTGFPLERVDDAVKLRKTTQAIIDSGQPAEAFGRTSVRSYATRWLKDRRSRGLKTVDDDETRLERHVLAHELATGRQFGALFMDEVRPLHCRGVIAAVRQKGLAPKTVLNINAVGHSMFKDAIADELIAASPWVVPTKDLPKKRDKDPAWRATAKFSKGELRSLLWAPDEKVPWDRRMFYALMYFGAMRIGEAAARRWEDRLDPEGKRAIHVHNQFSTARGEEDETKTLAVRLMPEHPTLTTLLNEWHLSGWEHYFGRPPRPGDLIVPSRRGKHRRKNHSLHKLHEDLGRLGQRPRRQHDLRRSFIGHAVDDGATRDRLKPGTHGLGVTVLEMYDSPEWTACAEHVHRLKLDPPSEIVTLPLAKVMGSMGSAEPVLAAIHRHQKEVAGSKLAIFQGTEMTDSHSGTVFNSRRLRQQNDAEHAVRGISPAGSHADPTAIARALLDACDGDLGAAVAVLRAVKGGAS